MAPTLGSCSSAGLAEDNIAIFSINGKVYTVPSSLPGDTSLNTFIRNYALLKGTKFMCREGGCGACVVTLKFTHPVTQAPTSMAVNSCLFPVFACHGMAVTTIEGIGNMKIGYDMTQTRLANFNGTQCGYCSPGMVMNMYSLLKSQPKLTMETIEESFGGNICRCTGYRPILDAFKSFASNASEELTQQVADIEDVHKICPNSGTQCYGKCGKDKSKRGIYDCVKKEEEDDFEVDFIETAMAQISLKVKLLQGTIWYKVGEIKEIFEIFDMVTGSYQLVGGNTAEGVYKGFPIPDVYIDVNSVTELKEHYFDGNYLSLGGNMSLTDAINILTAVAQECPQTMAHAKVLADHIKQIANVPVRNVGTLAGNLSIKHQHREFPSDLFLILETVGAVVVVDPGMGISPQSLPLQMFLETDMYKKVITTIIVPSFNSNNTTVTTYKITPRAQNAHAYVNAGFKFKVDKFNKFRVMERPSIVYGGINSSFVHATQTENFLVDKFLQDVNVLQKALSILNSEINPDYVLPDATPAYRIGLTQSLFYKTMLNLFPDAVQAKFKLGGQLLYRPLSSGKQDFETITDSNPVHKPVIKLEAVAQCSGEAEYIYDMPIAPNELFAQLVITKHGPAKLTSLNASAVLKIPGVVAFYTAKDVPGRNVFTAAHPFMPDEEPLFVETDILYAGQVVGMIVATTQELADKAARLVVINYSNKKKPLIDVEAIVKSGNKSRIIQLGSLTPTQTKKDVQYKVTGTIRLPGQYQFTMETLTCYTVPVERDLNVYCSTQCMQVVQEAIAVALNIPENRVNVKVSKVGGGYGIKLTRACLSGVACSLAAHLLQKPVKMVFNIETMMEGIGKRYENYTEYEAGVNKVGQIQYLTVNTYEDTGSSNNDPVVAPFFIPNIPSVYDPSTWTVTGYNVKTDKPSSTWARAPGSLEAIAIIETIMEHIAQVVKIDPITVKMNNTRPDYPIANMIATLKATSDYDNRLKAVQKFNSENVWKKKGLSLVPMRFEMMYVGLFHAMVSIYRNDGTVAITHGGTEIGQGMNTKAAQVCAFKLGIGLEYIEVKASNNLTSPDSGFTGGSITSESVCLAIIKCCDELNARLDPVRKTLTNPTWEELVKKAYGSFVNLNASSAMTPLTDVKTYSVFGTTALEVEIDVLTGQHEILRVDILEDAGQSLSPLIDVGQVEGAFVMGLGYFTTEELKYDPNTGECLTNRTWTYKVPGARDIPIDFRVSLLKNSDNPLGVLRSKAVGEPPLCMSTSILFAIRQAVASARKDMGFKDDWFQFDPPYTAENIFLTAQSNRNKYLL